MCCFLKSWCSFMKRPRYSSKFLRNKENIATTEYNELKSTKQNNAMGKKHLKQRSSCPVSKRCVHSAEFWTWIQPSDQTNTLAKSVQTIFCDNFYSYLFVVGWWGGLGDVLNNIPARISSIDAKHITVDYFFLLVHFPPQNWPSFLFFYCLYVNSCDDDCRS